MKHLYAWITALFVLGSGFIAHAESPGSAPTSGPEIIGSEERNAMVGEALLCRSTLVMPPEGEGVFVCRLSQGLSFLSVTELEKEGECVNAAYYTVITARQGDAAFTLHVSPRAAEPGESLTVEYLLELNDRAEERNFFTLCADGEPPRWSCVRSFSVTAFRAVALPSGGQMNPVSGACLCLSRDREGHDRVAFRQRGEDRYLACAAEDCSHARHLYVMKTPRNGRVYLEGLSAGTYYLSETRPAEGMSALARSVEIQITETGLLMADGVLCPEGSVTMSHINEELPMEEKGSSLLEFYRRGSELLVMALLALFAARRYYI